MKIFWKDTQQTVVNITSGEWCWDSNLVLFLLPAFFSSYLNFFSDIILTDYDKRIFIGRGAKF